MEQAGDRYLLTAKEAAYNESRDSFYMATVGKNGWPYVQFRGGPKGFLKVIDASTLGYADFRGNGQCISTGNLHANNKASLILVDIPRASDSSYGQKQTSSKQKTMKPWPHNSPCPTTRHASNAW
jgi:predicted pyridoxine 5'-phosphate oxidase superfamily flavin-nucleotide-binding protein